MEGVKSLYVFVACERYNGLDLSATHCVFPAVAWTTFSVHIFFLFFLMFLLMIVFPSIISLSFLDHLKDIIDIIASRSNVLANFSFIFKIDQCFFMI